jgi:hypothetical protein
MKVSSWVCGIAAVVAGASVSVAQQKTALSHGSWLVGGTAGASHSNAGGGSTTAISFQPLGLYFVADRLAIGGTLDLAHLSNDAGNAQFHSSVVAAEPTIRWFFGDLTGKVFPYVNAAIGPSWERSKAEGTGTAVGEQTTTGLDLTGSAGLMRMLATHVGLNGEIYYSHRHRSSDVGVTTLESNSDNYGVRFGFNAFLF